MVKKAPTRKQLVQKDIGNYSALEAVRISEGGQLILASLRKDILSCIDGISLKYKDLSHIELISLAAKLAEKIALFRTLSRSSKNKKLALDELNSILEEDQEEDV